MNSQQDSSTLHRYPVLEGRDDDLARASDREALLEKQNGERSGEHSQERATRQGNRKETALMDRLTEHLPEPLRFMTLAGCVFLFFGAHNYLQEAITRMDGFQGLGSILGYLEVVGVMVCSFAERAAVGQWGCKVPALNYTQLTLCLLGSSYLSTVALDQINYPTKVVFRSCKLIPTMVVAFLMHKQRFSIVEILSALAVCGGLVMFALADMSGSTKSSTVLGMSLQAISAVADAFLPNLQQKLFDQGGSPLEVTAYTNLYVFVIMSILGGGSGHILGAIQFASGSAVGAVYLVTYTIVAYVAISFHMRVVKHYGSVVAVLVGNTRKAGTIALSFLVFPKPFSIMYVWGTLCVFGGLTATSWDKDRRKRAARAAASKELT